MSEWKHLDSEQPEIGENVLIYLRYYVGEQCIVKRSVFLQAIYSDEYGLPLMFHTLDYNRGYPHIKDWMKLPEPPKIKSISITKKVEIKTSG